MNLDSCYHKAHVRAHNIFNIISLLDSGWDPRRRQKLFTAQQHSRKTPMRGALKKNGLRNLKGRCVKVILIENWFIIGKSHLQKLIYRSIRSTKKESFHHVPVPVTIFVADFTSSFFEATLPSGKMRPIFFCSKAVFQREGSWGNRASSGWANKTFASRKMSAKDEQLRELAKKWEHSPKLIKAINVF